jgi:hypothetical protein
MLPFSALPQNFGLFVQRQFDLISSANVLSGIIIYSIFYSSGAKGLTGE